MLQSTAAPRALTIGAKGEVPPLLPTIESRGSATAAQHGLWPEILAAVGGRGHGEDLEEVGGGRPVQLAAAAREGRGTSILV
jgi:hypothetical protein